MQRALNTVQFESLKSYTRPVRCARHSIPTRQCLYAGSSSSKACHATHAHGAAVGRCAESSRRGAGRPRSVAGGRCAESSRRGKQPAESGPATRGGSRPLRGKQPAGSGAATLGDRRAKGSRAMRQPATRGCRRPRAESSRRGFTARPRSAAKSQRALAHRKSVQPLTSDDATGCRRGLVVQNGVTKGGALTCERETTPHVKWGESQRKQAS